MANRTHKTRQKLVFRVPVAKPRNPLAMAARQRSAGSHRKSGGAQRSALRNAWKKDLGGDDSGE